MVTTKRRYEESEEVKSAAVRVIEVLRGLRRGDILPWEVIEATAGFVRQSPHWSAFRGRLLRDFRKETGIVLWPVSGQGWKLLTIDEQLTWRSRKRFKRAARQLHKDIVELQSIPDRELSERQKQERAMRSGHSRDQMLSVRRANRVNDGFGREHRSSMPVPQR